MTRLRWSLTMLTGNETIDDQHKQLFAIINQLIDALRDERGHVQLTEIFQELFDYAHSHFRYEETLFVPTKYPQKAHHLEEHRLFLAKLEQYRSRFQAGTHLVTIDILHFLSQWITHHILQIDLTYVDWIASETESDESPEINQN